MLADAVRTPPCVRFGPSRIAGDDMARLACSFLIMGFFLTETDMRKDSILVMAMALVLAACGGADQSATGAQPQVSQVDDFSRRFTSVVLPQGVDLSFQFVLVSERLYTKNNGETRRGLVLEFPHGSAESIAQTLVADFAKAGYKPRRAPATESDGRVKITLTKKRAVPFYVEVRPTGERKTSVEGAAGTIWISWLVRGDAGNEEAE